MSYLLPVERCPEDLRDLRILDAVDDGECWATIAGRFNVTLKHIYELVNATLEGDNGLD